MHITEFGLSSLVQWTDTAMALYSLEWTGHSGMQLVLDGKEYGRSLSEKCPDRDEAYRPR